MPNLKDAPSPGRALCLSPSPKGGIKLQQPLKVTDRCGPQPNPSSSSSVAQQASTQGDTCQEMPMDTSEVCPWKVD